MRIRYANSVLTDAICKTDFFMEGSSEGRRETRTFDVSGLSPTMLHRLAAYGFAAAGKARYHGSAGNVNEALTAWDTFTGEVERGTWEPGRAASEAGPSILLLAIERVEAGRDDLVKHSRNEIQAWLDSLSPVDKRRFRQDGEVARAIAAIELERARDAQKAARSRPTAATPNLFTLVQPAAAE